MAGSRPSKNSHTLGRLFNDSLDWFDNVEFGEELRTDFQQKFLQLGCKRLRLSRWGQAVGLSGELKHLETEAVPTNELLQAEDTLRGISEVFSRFSRAFYARTTTPPQVLNYKEAMDPVGISLHDSIKALATQRKNDSQCMPKNRWAFFNENEFEQFLTALSPLVEKLMNTVPTALEKQQNLCEDEISQLGANENLRMLLGFVATQDKYLKKAISKALGLNKPGSNMNDQNNSYYHCKLNVTIHNMNDNNITTFHASF